MLDWPWIPSNECVARGSACFPGSPMGGAREASEFRTASL